MLRGLRFEGAPSELLLVCGAVGSGKSSLCAALLGLLRASVDGAVRLSGTVAYVPQTPFIMNASVRENVLFGGEYESAWYDEVISAAALDRDLASFPAGDMTEIGERGITISGGQRQRLAIARAAYARPDIVIMDDPLSGMDAYVHSHVYARCVLGLMAKATRIFATNQLQFAPDATRIIFLEGGEVVESGPFAELHAIPAGKFRAMYVHLNADGASTSDENGATGSAAGGDGGDGGDEARGGRAGDKSAGNGTLKSGTSHALVKAEERASGGADIWTTMWEVASLSDARRLWLVQGLVSAFSFSMRFVGTYFVGRWADALVNDDPGSTYLWLFVCTSLTFFFGTGLRGVLVSLFYVESARALHDRCVRRVLLSPIRFFDTTPIGRMINRFSGDMLLYDVQAPSLSHVTASAPGTHPFSLHPCHTRIIPAPPSILSAPFRTHSYRASSRSSPTWRSISRAPRSSPSSSRRLLLQRSCRS